MAHFILEHTEWLCFLFGFLFAGLFAIGATIEQRKGIQVIKRRKKKIEWHRVTCSNCGSELKFSSEHIKKKDNSEIIPGVNSLKEYIVCPVCGKEIGINYQSNDLKQ